MAKSERQKKLSKTKQIDTLRKELMNNDKIFKNNHDDPRMAVQIGLRSNKIGLNKMYDDVLEELGSDITELDIKIKSGFKVINPMFEYQLDKTWLDIQVKNATKQLKESKSNFDRLTEAVKEVRTAISEQNERIKQRRSVILEELKELGSDTADFEKPNYLG